MRKIKVTFTATGEQFCIVDGVIPEMLVKLISGLARDKADWHGYKLNLARDERDDLYQEYMVMGVEIVRKREVKTACMKTYLSNAYEKYFLNLNDQRRPGLREKHGIGRIAYDSEHPSIKMEWEGKDE